MTTEAINQAMAELDGWKLSNSAGYRWTSPSGTREIRLPHDYTEDLNAVHRVAGRLNSFTAQEEQKELRKVVLGRNMPMALGELSWIGESKVCNATALQRCEAILRAVGKWVDS